MKRRLLTQYQTGMILALVLAVTGSCFAQTETPGSHVEVSPKVTAVSGKLELGKDVVLNVEHLAEWSQNHDPEKLIPFIEGRSLMGLYPEQVDLSHNELRYHLQRTPATKRVWKDLFHEPVLTRPVSLSVGLENQPMFDSVFDYDHQIPLTIIPLAWGIVSLVVIVLTLVVFTYLAKSTNLIRDPRPTTEPLAYRPYSLGRAQMAFWFLLISVCYVSLWLITGEYDTIGRSQFVLAIISSVTAVGSHLVSGGPSNHAPKIRKGFLVDLLSDANGVRFHRFQLCAWTLLLGLIFAATVYDDLVMPEFGDTLLALAGFSSATHVGFTYLEQNGSRIMD